MTRKAPSPSSDGAVMWKASRAHAVADDLGEDRGAAPLGEFQFLEHQDAGAFADHEAVAVLVPRAARRAPGSSLRVESARMAAKPPTPIGVMQASAPPQIMTSASPRWMMRKESPMQCALVVQAVAVAEFGPLAPVRMET